MEKIKEKYNVLIVGAGPAGLMAAAQYSGDYKIAILEKMDVPAIKLKLTGKGRCNITNEASIGEFIKHFGKKGRFLRQAFGQFFNTDLINYFEKLGVKTKLERGGRYFPESDSAMEVANALVKDVLSRGVEIIYNSEVVDIRKNKNIFEIRAKNGFVFESEKIIIACGGKSYPKTGSSGDGYKLAKKLGHKIINPKPSLTPLITGGSEAGQLQGLSLKNIKVNLYSEKKKIVDIFGEMMFADFGLTGPVILSLSKYVVPLLSDKKHLEVSIDLKPVLDFKKLDERLKREIDNGGKKYFKSLLKNLLPAKLIPFFNKKLNIPADKKLNQINSKERKRLKILLKDLRFEIVGYKSFDQAIITSGGVDLREVDPKTMESKLVSGLYFAGEVLDVDADTGGFNLQAAFSTGRLAGKNINN